MPLGALRERRATPPAVGFPQKKVFEHKLRFAGGKRSSAVWTPYLRIDAFRQCLSSNHLIERPAMGADKARREEARQRQERELAKQAEIAAQAAAEAARAAADEAAREAAEQSQRNALLEAEQKATRDARYAARKAAKKKRRRGY